MMTSPRCTSGKSKRPITIPETGECVTCVPGFTWIPAMVIDVCILSFSDCLGFARGRIFFNKFNHLTRNIQARDRFYPFQAG